MSQFSDDAALQAALTTLLAQSDDVLVAAVRRLRKALRLPSESDDAKFRTFRFENRVVREVLAVDGARALFLAGGWVERADALALAATSAAASRGAADALDARLRRRVRWARDPADGLGGAATFDGARVGRAAVDGGLHAGAIVEGSLRVSYGGGVRSFDVFETLCGEALGFEACAGGAVPPRALRCGWEADGDALYLALVDAGEDGKVAGKVRGGFGGALYAADGAERCAERYAVVTLADDALHVDRAPPEKAPPPPRRFLVSVDELVAWAPGSVANADLERCDEPLDAKLPDRCRVLHCHDMAGGYCKLADETYAEAFASWREIDVFCYFGHKRVTVPPANWIRRGHRHGKPVLGTLIVEGADGAKETTALVGDARAVDKLAALAAFYGFDGWLLNFESHLEAPEQAPRLVDFVRRLTAASKAANPHALVVVYDAVVLDSGRVEYQNALTERNVALFAACDAIFLNYWWGLDALLASRALAGGRRADVYAGVDVFARNCAYGAGPGAADAVATVAAAGVSVALFAPGWTLEARPNRGDDDDAAADAAFWTALDLGRVRESG